MLRLSRTRASGHRRLAHYSLSHRLLAVGAALGGALLAPDEAGACGVAPTPGYTISGVLPGPDATGQARDGGIIVRGRPSSEYGGPADFADITLIDVDSGQSVPLQVLPWSSPQHGERAMAVHPLEPLAPLHRYRVEADPEEGETGADSGIFVSSFETSEVLLEPLTLTGDFELFLRGEEVNIVQCGSCGEGCSLIGRRPALMVDVQLPIPSGGQGVYRGVLHFTDHTPARVSAGNPAEYVREDGEAHDIQLTQWVEPRAMETTILQQEILLEEAAYAPCFTYVVYDPAGHVAQASACLPSLSPSEIEALASDESPVVLDADPAPDNEDDNDVAAEQVQTEAPDPRDPRASGPLISCALESSPQPPRGWPAGSTVLLSSLVVISAMFRRVARRR